MFGVWKTDWCPNLSEFKDFKWGIELLLVEEEKKALSLSLYDL